MYTPHTYIHIHSSHICTYTIGIAEKDYYTTRATSSVPAALISRVPLIAQRDFLNIYPCLRDAPIHTYISQHTECYSIEKALNLNNIQYIQAQNEIINCSKVFWEHAKHTFKQILSRK